MVHSKEYTRSTTTADISWDSDKESLLREIRIIISDLLDGSPFYPERNSTPGEKSIDLFKCGQKNRIGSIWPKNRKKCLELHLKVEYIKKLRLKLDLPEDQDVKKGRYPGFRKFEALSIEKTIEILDCLTEGEEREKKRRLNIEKFDYDVSNDSEYVDSVSKTKLTKYADYVPKPEKAPEKVKTSSGEKYKRDPKQGAIALERANYTCECCNRDPKDISFHRASDGKNYMEAHHIVPMANQGAFKDDDVSLDIPANIVSLCCLCHRTLHYGDASKYSLLEKLYDKRRKELIASGIEISLEELKQMY